MHIFLYEWITGGGLVEEWQTLPASLLAEGSAMIESLASDFLGIDNCAVSILRDIRHDAFALPGCEVVEIHSNSHHHEAFAHLTASADHTLVIAPEFDNILLNTLALARDSGGHVIAPTQEFVALTSDKHQTAQRCHHANVPTPPAVLFDADQEKLPLDFDYPAVLKPVMGAGSQHTLLISGANDQPPPYPWMRRLEKFCPGIACSTSFLCGPEHRVALAPCRQQLSTDDRMTYLGGSLLWEEDLASRATRLAERVLDVLPGALGYVSIDLVLGKAADGSEDFIFEVNPRMTTSYVGLRAATDDNLAAALLANAAGQTCRPQFRLQPLEFFADGTLRIPLA